MPVDALLHRLFCSWKRKAFNLFTLQIHGACRNLNGSLCNDKSQCGEYRRRRCFYMGLVAGDSSCIASSTYTRSASLPFRLIHRNGSPLLRRNLSIHGPQTSRTCRTHSMCSLRTLLSWRTFPYRLPWAETTLIRPCSKPSRSRTGQRSRQARLG